MSRVLLPRESVYNAFLSIFNVSQFDAPYGRLLEPKGLKLTLLKSTFNAENFICRLSWSVSSDFGPVHC